jgi:DNA-nicking Smr family endonuclease
VLGFYTPFGSLDQHLKELSRGRAPEKPEKKVEIRESPKLSPREAQEEAMFREAMSGVVRLAEQSRKRVPPPPPNPVPPRFLMQEEMEAYSHLAELVAGEAQFELSLSDEYIDGAVIGLSPEVLKKLRKGEFSYQDHIDLHGCTRSEGRENVTHFILECFDKGYRCVLVVSGRGLNSKDKVPVLKHGLVQWLTQAPLKRLILAFASARSHDGGAGAFYVLMRRNPRKGTFSKLFGH